MKLKGILRLNGAPPAAFRAASAADRDAWTASLAEVLASHDRLLLALGRARAAPDSHSSAIERAETGAAHRVARAYS